MQEIRLFLAAMLAAILLPLLAIGMPALAQESPGGAANGAQEADSTLAGASMARLTQAQDYVLKRSSSYDRTGGNEDYRQIAPGETLTLLDATGPGEVTHVWVTIASDEMHHLKRLVLRWSGTTSRRRVWKHPSVICLVSASAITRSTSPHRSLSARTKLSIRFSRCRSRSTPGLRWRIRERAPVDALYFNIDYRSLARPLAHGTLYFPAQYRQCAPACPSTATART